MRPVMVIHLHVYENGQNKLAHTQKLLCVGLWDSETKPFNFVEFKVHNRHRQQIVSYYFNRGSKDIRTN